MHVCTVYVCTHTHAQIRNICITINAFMYECVHTMNDHSLSNLGQPVGFSQNGDFQQRVLLSKYNFLCAYVLLNKTVKMK